MRTGSQKMFTLSMTVLLIAIFVICLTIVSGAQTGDLEDECRHSFTLTKSDRDVHWNECEKCGEKTHIEMHTFENGVCTVCGEEEILYGDANGDGKIDSRDIILLKKYIANYKDGKSSVTLGHNVVIDPGYPATCADDGMTDGKKCADCGKILASKETIPATGRHVEGEIIVDIESTATANGSGHTECINCGEIIRKDIPIEKKRTVIYTVNGDGKTCTVTGPVGKTLTAVTIPSMIDGYKVTSIGYSAFDDCKNLTSITIPDSVTSIDYMMFSGCTSLTGITIPNGVTYIGSDAFKDCTSLTNIIIGNSVKSIGDRAFSGCTSLTSVTFSDSVTRIGYSAFSGCTSLTSIVIPDSVTSIDEKAFSDCTSLTRITIPDSVTIIDEAVFSGCTGLTSITIPNSVTSIGIYAFECCTSLTSITIPDSVTSIGYSAFDDCTNLKKVYYGGKADEWSGISIESWNGDLTSATLYYFSEAEPTEDGSYWHYVDGVVTEW